MASFKPTMHRPPSTQAPRSLSRTNSPSAATIRASWCPWSRPSRTILSKKPVAIVSYDEKPGIQAIATTAPDLPPVPGAHPAFARDHEYKRHGTLSLLAGIDLLTGKVHPWS